MALRILLEVSSQLVARMEPTGRANARPDRLRAIRDRDRERDGPEFRFIRAALADIALT